MQAKNAPPTRSSPRFSIIVKPRGQDHWARCCGSVQARNTSARGASKVRRMVSSSSVAPAAALFRALACMFSLLALQSDQIGVEPLEALLPVAAITLDPLGHVAQRLRPQAAGPRLGPAGADDEPRALEHLQVL